LNLLLLLALLQSPASETPVEAHVEAFLKGNAKARGDLVKLGAYAVLPLMKVREIEKLIGETK
jgi:hypothetical protein